jgi:hypothetical protein
MNNKLKWKKYWLSDKSGYWYSAKIPIINWEYIIDPVFDSEDEFKVGIFYTKFDHDINPIDRKYHKSLEKAKEACENHLIKTYNQFNTWINKIKK